MLVMRPVGGPHLHVRTAVKILIVVITGHPFIMILINLSRNEYNAKRKVGCPEVMSCLLDLFYTYSGISAI